MKKLEISTDLAGPHVFGMLRNVPDFEIFVSPSVEGFRLLDEQGSELVAGTERRDLQLAMREIVRASRQAQ